MPRGRESVSMRERLERRRLITDDGCWFWTGRSNNAGYGLITMATPVGKATQLVHRVSYEFHVGPIPDGLHMDHLCRNRLCFNPAHLEPVTPRENLMRSPIAPAAINARKTHCPKGHEYTPDNLYAIGKGGRQCRACHAVRKPEGASA